MLEARNTNFGQARSTNFGQRTDAAVGPDPVAEIKFIAEPFSMVLTLIQCQIAKLLCFFSGKSDLTGLAPQDLCQHGWP